MNQTLPRLCLSLLVLLLLRPPMPLLAHAGGLPRVSDVEAGPYRLFIWAEPEPALTGEINFTVAVTQIPAAPGAQADPVLDADVQVHLERIDGAARPISGAATHAQAVNKLMYENYLRVSTPGLWRATVTVVSDLGAANTAFDFEVLPSPGTNWTWPVVGGVGLLALILGARFLSRPRAAVRPSRHPGPKRVSTP